MVVNLIVEDEVFTLSCVCLVILKGHEHIPQCCDIVSMMLPFWDAVPEEVNCWATAEVTQEELFGGSDTDMR